MSKKYEINDLFYHNLGATAFLFGKIISLTQRSAYFKVLYTTHALSGTWIIENDEYYGWFNFNSSEDYPKFSQQRIIKFIFNKLKSTFI